MALLDRAALRALPGPTAGKFDVVHWDDKLPGFGLRVLASGPRAYIVRYRVNGKSRVHTLGRIDGLSLDQARKLAGELLAKARLGVDTRAAIEAARAQAKVQRLTYRRLVELYLAACEADWRPAYAHEVRRYLLTDAAPLLDLPAATIEPPRLKELLDGLAKRSPSAAEHGRKALASLWRWAMQHGHAEANPAANLPQLAKSKAGERTLGDEEIGALWRATAEPGDFHRIVRLLLLTGQRRDEVGEITWSEISLEKAVWTLPGARTKNHLPHEIPLAAPALAILSAVPRREGRDLLFGYGKGGFAGYSQCKARLDAALKFAAPWKLHDLRRTLSTGMAELGVADAHVEAVLNHVSGHKAGVAGVYNKAQYRAQKRAALELWAAHVTSLGERTP